jgi:hypothetical protein
MLVFFCIPVGPGRSRVIWAFPRNVGVWLHHITPQWLYHVGQNLDSDIFLLHVEVHSSSSVSVRHTTNIQIILCSNPYPKISNPGFC